MDKENSNVEIDIEKLIEEVTSAEFWASLFGKDWKGNMPDPYENFRFNINKAEMLNFGAKNVFILWNKIAEKENSSNDIEKVDEGNLDSLAEKGLALYYAFTEQSLVATITAFETYIKDRIVLAFKNKPEILKTQSNKKIKVEEILEKGPDLTESIHEIIGRNIDLNFWEPGDVNQTYDNLFGFKPLETEEEIVLMKEIFRIRHIIVHNGGLINQEFQSKTSLEGDGIEVGNRYVLERDEIDKYRNFFLKIAKRIERKMKKKNL